ncbi:MAG: GspMb/PilO family protein [Terriglobia bacterium]|jgi:Tfp pilus assembly protein PilO
MSKDRRKNLIRMVERVAVGVIALDAVLYFVAVQPLRSKTQERLEQFNNERAEIRNEEARVRRLEWYEASVPTTEKELNDFLGAQVQARRKSFTRLAQLLRGIADRTGVELSNFTYKPDTGRDEPLERMNISVNVTGSFPGLMEFAHGLETTSSDFIVIHDFNFDARAKESGGGNVDLKLSADLYLTP